MQHTPDKITDIVRDSQLDISLHNFKNIRYRGIVYSLCYSWGARGYIAIFSGYTSIYDKTPVMYNEDL